MAENAVIKRKNKDADLKYNSSYKVWLWKLSICQKSDN